MEAYGPLSMVNMTEKDHGKWNFLKRHFGNSFVYPVLSDVSYNTRYINAKTFDFFDFPLFNNAQHLAYFGFSFGFRLYRLKYLYMKGLEVNCNQLQSVDCPQATRP